MLFWKRKPLDPLTEKQIVKAIKDAEERTSAEIRVTIEKHCRGDPLKRAVKVFEDAGMTATQERNGVLIYVALKDRKFAIIGDKGIHEKVGHEFWKEVARTMKNHFVDGDIAGGIVEGVRRAGEILARYFPYPADDDNELSDEILY